MYAAFANFLVVISTVLPVLYLLRYKHSGKAYKLFTWYLILVAVIQVTMLYYAYYRWNNLFMSHFYFIGQFILLSLFYCRLLSKKWILWVLGSVLIALALQYTLQPSIFKIFNTYGLSITQTILVLYAYLYFQKSLTTKGAFIYVNTGVLFYLITSILYFASYNLILERGIKNDLSDYISWLHNILYFVFQVLIFIEWYRTYRVNSNATTDA